MTLQDRRNLPYRPCVGVMLVNQRGLVFIGKRKTGAETFPSRFAWQMPQGGLDEGEEPYQAAVRELYEETNIRNVKLLAEMKEWLSYDLPAEMVGKGWTKAYRGQTQKWFAFRFTGSDDEIDIDHPGGGKHRPEFEAWRWEDRKRLPNLVVPFKRPIYEKIITALKL